MREDDPAAQTEQRQRVMRAMAQQRLESEVATLERSLQQTPAGSVAAPYIVPDTLTLVSHLPAFRKVGACVYQPTCALACPSDCPAFLGLL